MLIVLPLVHESQVMVIVVAPTVMDEVPLNPPLLAVTVTALVVVATPVARPAVLTAT